MAGSGWEHYSPSLKTWIGNFGNKNREFQKLGFSIQVLKDFQNKNSEDLSYQLASSPTKNHL